MLVVVSNMSELRQRRGEGDGNDKPENAGESDHVRILLLNSIKCIRKILFITHHILVRWIRKKRRC